MTGKRDRDFTTRNLELFRKGAPEIYARLMETEADAGRDRGRDHGIPAKPTLTARFTVMAPVREHVDAHTFAFLQGALGKAAKEGIAFFPGPRTEEAYFLAIVGAGDGDALLGLLDRTKSLCVIFVEPDPGRLRRSLDTVDWTAVFRAILARKGELHFLLEADPDRISANVWRVMRTTNPAAADNLTVVVNDHHDVARRVIRNFADELQLVVSSLGFFHDETLMLANAHRNFRRADARVFRSAPDGGRPLPAFVIGSGPSLDWAIDAVKAQAGKAIVISSGSAIRPLMKSGIVPDFQIEIENLGVSPLTTQVAREHDISGVHLVTACTVDPGAVADFDDVVFFFRKALSPYPLFCRDEDWALPLPDPTVANAAMSFAQATGFRDIYLFGVDLGSQMPHRHHAKDSHHHTPGAAYTHVPYDIPVEANFGGTCFTNRGLFAARDNMIEAIRGFGDGRRYYNCSDGVAIRGARPTRPEEARIAEPAIDKRRVVADILGGFPTTAEARLVGGWPGDAVAKAIDAYVRQYSSCLEAVETFQDRAFHRALMALMRPHAGFLDAPERTAAAAVNILFRGTLFGILIYFDYYLARVADPALADRFGAIAREELLRRLRTLKSMALECLGGAAPMPPGPGITAPPGERLPDPLRISRNAPCPCGSGRKYKRCHGKAD